MSSTSGIGELKDKTLYRNAAGEVDEDLRFLVQDVKEKYGNVAIVDARFTPTFGANNIINGPGGNISISGVNASLIPSSGGVPSAIYVLEAEPPDPKEASRPVIDGNRSAMIYGDPLFVGFEGNGENFFINGQIGKSYDLLSDKGLQVNGTFVRSGGTVTYLGDVGVDIRRNKIQYFVNGDPPTINGRNLNPGETIKMTNDSVSWDGYTMIVTTKEYVFKISKHRLEVTTTAGGVFKDGVMPHGLLGQTADEDTNVRRANDYQGSGAIDGNYADYEVSSIFSTNDKFSRFGHKAA